MIEKNTTGTSVHLGHVPITPKIRGVVARAKSRSFGVSDAERASTFRQSLHYALIRGRSPEAVAQPVRFFSSVKEATAVERARFSRLPIHDDYLRILAEPRELPIEDEIVWCAARLSCESDNLSNHAESWRAINEHVLGMRWDEAFEALDAHEALHGISLWSVGLRIPVIQERDGTAAQKAYTKERRNLARRTILPFYATLISQRAEPKTSIGWFLDDTARRLERMISSDIREYLRFKLLSIWPNDVRNAGYILRIEQCHNLVDQYETLVRFLQRAVSVLGDDRLRTAILRAIELLSSIKDVRISKLRRSAGLPHDAKIIPTNVQMTDLALGPIASGQATRAYRAAIRGPLSFNTLVGAAMLCADRPALVRSAGSESSRNAHHLRLVRGLALALARQSDSPNRTSHLDYLKKYGYVFDGTSSALAIRRLLLAIYTSDVHSAQAELHAAALSSDEDGLFDLITSSATMVESALYSLPENSPTSSFARALRGNPKSESRPFLSSEAAWYASLTACYFLKDFDATLRIFANIDQRHTSIGVNQGALIALSVLAGQGDAIAAASLIASQHIDRHVDAAALPVVNLFQDAVWRDLSDSARQIELSNALALLPAKQINDRLRSYRRFALESYLEGLSIDRPSHLISYAKDIPKEQLVFFLDSVCTSQMLDMLPSIKNSREVLLERREICGLLVTLERENGTPWEEEIIVISRELSIQAGLETIDGSRVHVDLEAIYQMLKQELAETYQRYVSLNREDSKPSDNFEIAYRELLRRDINAKAMLAIKVSEGDELLYSMILRARELFLLNVPHGLDSYLSKRIRHGSIVGFIRSPAERDGIIAQRADDGTYSRHGTWADQLVDFAQRAKLTDAIVAFSKAIDDRLIRLRDVLLHVRSDEKPLGMLDVRPSNQDFALIKRIADQDYGLEAFVDVLVAAMRGLLRPSLLNVRDFVNNDELNFISSQLETLRSRAHEILTSQNDAFHFDSALGRASTAMQAAVVSAAHWFDPLDLKPRDYSLDDVVNIAVASVRVVTKDFSPTIDFEGDTTARVSEQTFPHLIDILYVAFGNIAEHAKLSHPLVHISAAHDDVEEKIKLRIENTFASTKPLAIAERDLSERRAELTSGQPASRARMDKNSGLHKIASIVRLSSKGNLDFGIVEDRFYVEFCLPFPPVKAPE